MNKAMNKTVRFMIGFPLVGRVQFSNPFLKISALTGPQAVASDFGAANSANKPNRPSTVVFATSGAARSSAVTAKRASALVCTGLTEIPALPENRPAAESGAAKISSSPRKIRLQNIMVICLP
ncbi:MAG: hypothetical protein IPF83_03445 [Rhodanobacteraceae bacterium]|nr:hypothetical protein [Rhodanobacteraceae bacterium]MBP9155810.1 hypothetical protein [Xanthomonadales bacterium]